MKRLHPTTDVTYQPVVMAAVVAAMWRMADIFCLRHKAMGRSWGDFLR